MQRLWWYYRRPLNHIRSSSHQWRSSLFETTWPRKRYRRSRGSASHFSSSVRFSRLVTLEPNSSIKSGLDATIFALSSAPGRAAIAIVRISGPRCLKIYEAICPGKAIPKARLAVTRTLYFPNVTGHGEGDVLDSQSLVLYFPGPRSATGEDVLELHIHGGPATVKALLVAIASCNTKDAPIRYAEPGEFTWRAFSNDRLDLTQVEALSDTLSAVTEQQRKLSVRGTRGQLAKQYEHWRHHLLEARGELEALIDFQEDQHFDESPAELAASVATQIRQLLAGIDVHRSNATRGKLLREGIKMSLLGAPNAGKSSLLNRIVGREAAIVSSEAGTTRDVVEVAIDIGGFLCQLGDTAGLRSAQHDHVRQTDRTYNDPIGPIEREGIRRAKQQALDSDIVLVLLPIHLDAHQRPTLEVDPEIVSIAKRCAESGSTIVVIVNKTDLVEKESLSIQLQEWRNTIQLLFNIAEDRIFATSCTADKYETSTTNSIRSLLNGLERVFTEVTTAIVPAVTNDMKTVDTSIWQESLGVSTRHKLLLDDCAQHLEHFLTTVNDTSDIDSSAPSSDSLDIVVAAENLRFAADCLARVTGRGTAGDVEEVLGVVFAKFCVGK